MSFLSLTSCAYFSEAVVDRLILGYWSSSKLKYFLSQRRPTCSWFQRKKQAKQSFDSLRAVFYSGDSRSIVFKSKVIL